MLFLQQMLKRDATNTNKRNTIFVELVVHTLKRLPIRQLPGRELFSVNPLSSKSVSVRCSVRNMDICKLCVRKAMHATATSIREMMPVPSDTIFCHKLRHLLAVIRVIFGHTFYEKEMLILVSSNTF